MQPRRKLTDVRISDVAREAGVSPATVSRVINRPGIVAGETAGRVQAVIDRLGYQPNRVAASLRSGSHGAFSLLVADIADPFFARATKSVGMVGAETGNTVLLYDLHHDDEYLVSCLQEMPRRGVDGVLLYTADVFDDRSIDAIEALSHEIPIVVVGQRLDSHGITSVVSDQSAAAELAVQHLHEVGCESIAFLGAEPRSVVASERVRGFTAAAKRFGYASKDARAVPCERGTAATAFAAATALFDRRPPDGLVVLNDQVALGAMRAIALHGLSIPGDVALVTFDVTEIGLFAAQPLTSISTAGDDRRDPGAELLCDKIAGRAVPVMTTIGHSLNVRESSSRLTKAV